MQESQKLSSRRLGANEALAWIFEHWRQEKTGRSAAVHLSCFTAQLTDAEEYKWMDFFTAQVAEFLISPVSFRQTV